MHMPKVEMLAPGLKSMIVHAGVVAMTGLGVAVITDGVVPIEHWS